MSISIKKFNDDVFEVTVAKTSTTRCWSDIEAQIQDGKNQRDKNAGLQNSNIGKYVDCCRDSQCHTGLIL